MALYQETKIRPILQEQSGDRATPSEEEDRIENLPHTDLQRELGMFIQTSLTIPEKKQQALTELNAIQDESLHLTNPLTQEKTPINVSLEPIIISQEAEKKLSQFVSATNLVRSAILMKTPSDKQLRAFFESGVDPLAIEIMRKNDYSPMKAQWRFRADTATQPDGSVLYAIENNGGEPQGDRAASDAKKIVERVLSICLDVPEDAEIKIAPAPDEQLMKVINSRYRLVTGKTDQPTIGYFAWRGRSSYSEGEARYSAQRYHERYPQAQSTQFDPEDIVDIKEVKQNETNPYYVIVCKKQESNQLIEIDMVRRLHGEPMENIDLWKEFKMTYGQKMCSDGQETIWDRFTGKLSAQMVNPLNSYATDKKLDAILGNETLLQHFGIWETVDQILADEELCKNLSLPKTVKSMGMEGIRDMIMKVYPRAFMLRRQNDGLYTGDTEANQACLSNDDISTIKKNRSDWVLKRSSLVGHSGTAVHVGKSIAIQELDYEDFVSLPDDILQTISGMSRKIFEKKWSAFTEKELRNHIAETTSLLDEEKREQLQDDAWSVLIENSLNKPDCLVQQAVPQVQVPVLLFDNSKKPQLQTGSMNYDLDPQSIGPGIYTYPFIRVTSAAKTNITGGYGAFGVAISESMARSMLKYAKQKGLY